ncbi:MAG TPA: energy transducer TonB [Bacteroidales bacterium]|nr:energy transducer TonB [Bacteroidales bacterium]
MKNFILTLIYILLTLTSITAQNDKLKKYDNPQNMDVVIYQEANYPKGDTALTTYINDNLIFPNNINDNIIAGEIILSFNVMPDSSLTEIACIKGIGKGNIDEQVINLFKNIKYAPSIQNGIKTKTNIIVFVPVKLKRPKN